METLLDCTGKCYKGNLHMHTSVSDGRRAPQQAAWIYRNAGYDFIALTDHWKQSEEQWLEGMLLLPGIEVDTGNMVETSVYHVIGVGMKEKVQLDRNPLRDVQAVIDAIRKAGGIAILAHPTWSVTDPEAVRKLNGLAGIEIYNTVSGLPWNGARADASLYFDIWASKGNLFTAIAADDCHHYDGDQGISYVMVNAESLSVEAIQKAIIERSFYSTQGPRFLRIQREGDKLFVEYENAETIIFYSNCIWCFDRVQKAVTGKNIYQIKDVDRYVRIELIDKEGRRAWTSPYAV